MDAGSRGESFVVDAAGTETFTFEELPGLRWALASGFVKGELAGLLKKSAPLNVGEKRVFNVVESRETMLNNGKTAALAFRCVPLKGSQMMGAQAYRSMP